MTEFVAEHRDTYGVEPICRVLKIAPSTYAEREALRKLAFDLLKLTVAELNNAVDVGELLEIGHDC
jgi:hypothetical protein